MRFIIFFIATLLISQASFSEDLSDFQNTAPSPDGKWIAFVKSTKKVVPDKCLTTDSDSDSDDNGGVIDPVTGQTMEPDDDKNDDYASQIWIYDVKSKKERLLVKDNFACQNPEKQMLDPQQLHFSPDSKKLYFIATGWVTSGALHVVNVDGKNEHYLIPANEFSIIPKGQYKGDIIAWEHRYFEAGGSYNWYWLYLPSGKQIGPLGSEVTKDQKEFLESDFK